MYFLKSVIAATALAHTCTARSIAPKIQLVPRQTPPEIPVADRAQAVKDAFSFAFNNYYENAFPADQLNPNSNTPSNPRNGWGASAIDGLDTAAIMELGDIVNNILDYIPTINFGVSINDEQVSLFETTIRYVGGLLSAYDLLNDAGPLPDLATNKANVAALLTQAEGLANNLSFAFETPSRVPSNNLYFNNRSTDGSTTNGLATVGTLVLEWQHLSDLSGNATYGELAQTAENYLLNPTPPESQPFPGLVGQNIYLDNGSFADAFGGWVGGSDSFYEYLIKMYIYNPTAFDVYRQRWIAAADSSIQNLASHPSSRPDLTYLAEYNNTDLILESGHLACFDGGNFLLAGQVLRDQTYIDFGLDLTIACHNTYSSTVTQIGPESFDWDASSIPPEQQQFYQDHGFYITNGDYDLRPEVIESYYYAYQVTGNTTYQQWAWDAFVAINATCRAPFGFTEVSDVNAPNGGTQQDNQESFVFAETLKYAYLAQAPVSTQLNVSAL